MAKQLGIICQSGSVCDSPTQIRENATKSSQSIQPVTLSEHELEVLRLI
ncbi:hypothetical protein [Nostoc sp.]